MIAVDALVLPGRKAALDRVTIGGRRGVERIALALRQAGVERIVLASGIDRVVESAAWLLRHGVPVVVADGSPASAVRPDVALIVVTADVVFAPDAVAALFERGQDYPHQALCASAALAGVLAYVPAFLADGLRDHPSVKRALWSLYRSRRLVLVDVEPAFCRPVPADGRVWRVEAEDMRHRSPASDVFARAVRAHSVPLSQLLLRLHVTSNGVTALGLGLAVLAGALLARGDHWSGVFGSLACLASVVLARSGREVGRATLADPRSARRFERFADRLSYFLLLGGVAAAEAQAPGWDMSLPVTAVAAPATLGLMVTIDRVRHSARANGPRELPASARPSWISRIWLERVASAGRLLVSRAFTAHVLVLLAVAGGLQALPVVWACTAVLALATLLAVKDSLWRIACVLPEQGRARPHGGAR